MKNKKGAIAVFAVIIAIVAITAGAIGWTLAKKSEITTTQPLKVEQKQSAVSTTRQRVAAPEQSADWQTYQNSKYGFTFQYPKDLVAEENPNVDYFSLDISDISDYSVDAQQMGIDFNIKKTNYKNTNEWFTAWKNDFEKPSDYEGITIQPVVSSITSFSSNGVEMKRYVPGGGEFPFHNVCVGFVRNGYEYNMCYNGGVKQANYNTAKIGVDEYGQNKYDEQKIADAKMQYQKLFDSIVATLKFAN